MNNSTKTVSVIIPVYNQEMYIGRCLRSLLDQSLNKNNYEIIVVNDGSTDKTLDIINGFGKDIKIINNKKTWAFLFSLNKGIKSSKGRFIVRVELR